MVYFSLLMSENIYRKCEADAGKYTRIVLENKTNIKRK